ncbi:MAG: 16S rRNA (guanine(527)-N(7))-methyltransferase RsmG, partial [Ignavibacteria bacterium]|nr:16S rRNA (guanine(527)-N(7))-methyltransferase RsmG [Ignavibacteria bacterium]
IIIEYKVISEYFDNMDSVAYFLELYVCKEADNFIAKFREYEKLLLEWNKKINLISRKQKGIEKIILDSIFFLCEYKFKGDEKIIDIGTGGGFPGIPLKIIYPNVKLTLVDSISKKVKALIDIVANLQLQNVDIICERAEVLSKKTNYKNKYDVVISKAVSNLVNLYKWSIDFLKTGGEMICIKGGDIFDELGNFKKKYPEIETKIRTYDMRTLLDINRFLNYKYSLQQSNKDIKHIVIINKNYE